MKRFARPFRQLQGKLTFSYTLTSVITFLFIEVLIIAGALGSVSLNVPAFVINDLQQKAPQAASYFNNTAPDTQALTTWLAIMSAQEARQDPFRYHPIYFAALDTQGMVLASAGTQPLLANTPLQTRLSAQDRANLHAVLHDVKGKTSLSSQDADGTLVAIAPIVGNGGHIEGVLAMKIVQPDRWPLLVAFFRLLVVSTVIVIALAAITGTVSGYFTARGFTSRFKRLSVATGRWSRGDFSALIHDPSEDELGQMSRQLNLMAEQLQNLLSTRQKLATLEERNRLARDLHDSIKQQIFAVSMQIGVTKRLLKQDSVAAEARLDKMEKLVQQAQQELTTLIRELRPVALDGKGLVAALRELTTQWAQQTEIVANLRTRDLQTLSLTVEEALFRVAQEALSNIARHSQATLVQIVVETADNIVTLSVLDNGQGFDMTQQTRLGIGLLSMQERMKALGGDAHIESTPGKGTCIVAHCNCLGVETREPMAAPTKESVQEGSSPNSANSVQQ
jgi:signal transduction histidine kinase